MAKIEIYTDGSAVPNPGKGGWAAVLLSGTLRKEISGGFNLTTNNRMELYSVLMALESLKKNGHDITIFSDSQYVVNSVEKGWLNNWMKTKKKVKNLDLWTRFHQLHSLNNIKFVWVKGHADTELNNRCDYLAKQESSKKNLPNDDFYISNN